MIKKLSLCMILKNEGKTIYRSLDSVKDIIDEWIIGIDDKCNDNTETEVDRFFKNNPVKEKQVYKFTFQDHFSKARNEGMDKATGDFIFILDGHEYVPDDCYVITEGKRISCKEVFKAIKKEVSIEKEDEIFFHLYQQPFLGEMPNNYFMQPRLYRNDPELRFNRAAHNTMMHTKPERATHYPEMVIIHDAPEDNRKERSKQRIRINIKSIKEDLKKNIKDTRAWFYLGNTYLEAKRNKQAVRCYNNYLKYRKDDNSEKYQVLLHKALANRDLKEYEQMKVDLHIAIKIVPTRRDAFCVLGDLYFQEKDYERALFYYNTALTIVAKPSRMFNNGGVYTWQPHQNISRCYAELKDIPNAIAHLKIAYSFVQNSAWVDQIKEWSGEKKNIYIIDKIDSFTNDFEKHLKSKGYNVIKTPKFDNALALWADCIWQEWADDNAIISSSIKKKVVIRVHGYEAYLNKGLFNQIKWDNTKVVFVAKHIKDMMKNQVNGNGLVIQNGVDLDNFYIKTKERDNKNIGYAGYINEKKNPFLLLQIIKTNPEYNFHLRVDWQSPFWQEEFKRVDLKNIVYHARYDNLNDFWNQMSGVLSTSIIESFSFNIGEAMAAGCKPYIYNWHGAKDIWNSKWIFENMPKFTDVDKEERKDYRQYIIDNYDSRKQLIEMERVLIDG